MYDEIANDLSDQYKDLPKAKMPRWGLAVKTLIDERKKHGKDVSVQWLAEKTGINSKHLFNIIAQRIKDPASDKLIKIADAFGITFSELAGRAASEESRNIHFTGFAQRGYIDYSQHGFTIQSLTPPGTGTRDFFMGIMIIKPLKELKKWKFEEASMVCLYVESGTIELTYGNKTHRIQANESVYFDGGIPHKLMNIDSIEAKVILVTSPPIH